MRYPWCNLNYLDDDMRNISSLVLVNGFLMGLMKYPSIMLGIV